MKKIFELILSHFKYKHRWFALMLFLLPIIVFLILGLRGGAVGIIMLIIAVVYCFLCLTIIVELFEITLGQWSLKKFDSYIPNVIYTDSDSCVKTVAEKLKKDGFEEQFDPNGYTYKLFALRTRLGFEISKDIYSFSRRENPIFRRGYTGPRITREAVFIYQCQTLERADYKRVIGECKKYVSMLPPLADELKKVKLCQNYTCLIVADSVADELVSLIKQEYCLHDSTIVPCVYDCEKNIVTTTSPSDDVRCKKLIYKYMLGATRFSVKVEKGSLPDENTPLTEVFPIL